MPRGPSTRAIHAGLKPARQGKPLVPGPVLAAPYHLSGDADAADLLADIERALA